MRPNGIFGSGGGNVQLEYNRFNKNETALKLDEKVTGHAVGNSFANGSSMFGRYFRPRGFRCSANECSGSEAEAENDSDGEA